MTVVNVRGGAATPDGFTVVTQVSSTANVRVAVANNPGMTGAVYFGPVTPGTYPSTTTIYVAKVDITGLQPDTRYWWKVEHNGTPESDTGTIETMPSSNTPASFRIGLSGDSGLSPSTPGVGSVLAANRISNHVIYSEIADRAVAENWKAFIHMGDEHYYDLSTDNHGIVGGASQQNFRRSYSDVLLQPNQQKLSRSVNFIKMVDDHDFLGNDSNGSSNTALRSNWAAVYREREPHYPLADPTDGAAYFSILIGRVLLIVTDSRYYSSPNLWPDDAEKTMWGEAQKTWLAATLATTAAKFVIFVTSRQWLRTYGEDTWSVFDTERQEIIQLLDGLDWSSRMCMVYADRHAFHLQKQDHQFGGFPVLTAAPLDASGGSPLIDYPDGIPDQPGDSHSQYGTVDIEDDGESIKVTLAGWRSGALLDSHTFTVFTPGPPVIPSQDVMEGLASGSHVATFQAVVLDTYQDGDEPNGVDIPIIDGDVKLDGAADIRGSLSLTTAGEQGGQLLWPSHATDLLAPFGNEIFVRRGIQINGQTVWSSLGYYRISNPDQNDAPDGPITLTGLDRMSRIIEARLLSPRSFLSNRTVHSVFDELVREVYPQATIVFDDPAVEFAQIGRLVESEDSRYDMLREVAESHGKIMYWDTSGILRVESVPDPQVPIWHFMAGRQNGVLMQASRSLSSEGVYNCVVASGEGASDEVEPVRAVVYDNNPKSPTYFFGRFGPIPKFYTSAMIVTEAQALRTATSMLRRSSGYPYNVNFTIAPNPAVRPHHPARVGYRDGKREIHVIESITIPLSVDAAMSGTTKEQTLTTVGELT